MKSTIFEHQSVELVAITKPEKNYCFEHDIYEVDSEDLISYCARVSNPSNQNNFSTSGKLLKYCMDNKHWSIFETVHVLFEINTTRDIGRQILRHRSFSFQEFSQRYADVNSLGFTNREARLQDTKNRQNSIDTDNHELEKAWKIKQDQILHEAKLAYKWALENGIAKEQARCVLPEGMTMSRMFMGGSLRSWITYIDLREKMELKKNIVTLQTCVKFYYKKNLIF